MNLGALRQVADFGRNSLLTAVALLVFGVAAVLCVRRLEAYHRIHLRFQAGDWSEPPPPPPGLWLHAAIVFIACAVVVAFAASCSTARGILLPLTPQHYELETGALASLFSRSIGMQLPTLAAAAITLRITLPAAMAAIALAMCARARHRGLRRAQALHVAGESAATAWLRHPSRSVAATLAMVVVPTIGVLEPLGHGVVYFTTGYMSALGKASSAPSGERAALLMETMPKCRALLETWANVAGVSLAVATIGAIVLGWHSCPERARRRLGVHATTRDRHPGRAWMASTSMVVLAAALFAVSAHLERESTTPWPPARPKSHEVAIDLETPGLIGPDPLTPAPLLAVTASGATLDGRVVDGDELARLLALLGHTRRNESSSADLELILACAPEVEAGAIEGWLVHAADAGYSTVTLAFARSTSTVRPVLGLVQYQQNSGVRARLGQAPANRSTGTAVVRLAMGTCATVSRELVQHRKNGRSVVLVVDQAPATSPPRQQGSAPAESQR